MQNDSRLGEFFLATGLSAALLDRVNRAPLMCMASSWPRTQVATLNCASDISDPMAGFKVPLTLAHSA